MIHHVNDSCNVRTGEHVNNPRLTCDVTIPKLRAVLTVNEADELAHRLLEAVEFARRQENDDRVKKA